MAQDRVPALERIWRVPFSAWIRQGFIEATPGNSIDLRGTESNSLRRGHCGDGNGPNSFDTLAALEQWVENGKATRR
jgi:hypothetical protein